MVTRILIAAGVSAGLVGCAVPWEGASPAPVETSVMRSQVEAWPQCPDRPDCQTPNGTGVYFAEKGLAAMTPFDLMITHFINNGTNVTVAARYRRASTGQWAFTTGDVIAALYAGVKYDAVSVAATGTVPGWKLRDPSSNVNIFLQDASLAGLTLVLRFEPDNDQRYYKFRFVTRATEATAAPAPTVMRKYPVMYQEVSAPPALAPLSQEGPYCVDASASVDPLVFQESIDVDPVTGHVARGPGPNTMVTLSCRKGAIATVFAWGYSYLGTPSDTFYFDAGIHMKRASYCGDGEAYTEDGTTIWIRDDKGIKHMGGNFLEAFWTPTGASCVTTFRRPDIVKERKFSGVCPTGPLTPCNPLPLPNPLVPLSLVDGPG